MNPEVRHVPVSLRSTAGSPNPAALLLRDHPVTFLDDKPEPLDHAGQRYVFSHVVEGGYSSSEPTVYVFSAP
ncbi:MAG TPA: hypothetical protein VGH52_05370 [Gaiellaceae bacterium]|jgi:hypothetical protein